MDAPAAGLVHKSARVTSATRGSTNQKAGSAAGGWVVGVYGVISFRKMRHVCRPSHCAASFLVNNNHRTGRPLHALLFNDTQETVQRRADPSWGVDVWGGGAGAVQGAEPQQDDSWDPTVQTSQRSTSARIDICLILLPILTSIITTGVISVGVTPMLIFSHKYYTIVIIITMGI